MRNLLNTALLAFEVLKTGNVGVGGSTGTVLHRSLLGARALTGRSLAEVRLAQGVQHQEQFFVGAFLDDLAPGAAIEGQARGIALRVLPVADGLVIEADRQVLTAVVINLLQNAFKFTRPGTTVVLRADASVERAHRSRGRMPRPRKWRSQRAVPPVRATRSGSNGARFGSRL